MHINSFCLYVYVLKSILNFPYSLIEHFYMVVNQISRLDSSNELVETIYVFIRVDSFNWYTKTDENWQNRIIPALTIVIIKV